MSSTIALGIDLGTTNSTASTKSNGRITETRFPGEGSQVASVVYWPGGEAPLVGQKAIRAAYKHPEFLYSHFKRRMYDDAYSQVYGGHSAVELTSVLIRYQSQLRISHFRRAAGRVLRSWWLVLNASLVACF